MIMRIHAPPRQQSDGEERRVELAAMSLPKGRSSSPPGAALQKINALLHEEPFATVFHCVFWSLILVVALPIGLLVLQARTLHQVLSYFWITEANGSYDPARRRESDRLELAVVITGCDSGFGKETAMLAAREGFVVFAACLQESSLQQFQCLENVIPLVVDVTNDRHVDEMVAKVQEWLFADSRPKDSPLSSTSARRILHALINNAGIAHVGDIDWIPLEVFQQAMDVNFFGIVRCCKAFLPILKQQATSSLLCSSYPPYKGSRILNVTSVAGLNAKAPFVGVYCASKFAAQGFSEALRLELNDWNIQVATINPTFHKTPICDDLATKLRQSWDQLPKAVQTQYGDDFISQSVQFTEQFVNRALWDMSVVVGQIIKTLKAPHIPEKVVVGSDARYVAMPLRLLPDWMIELAVRLTMPKPKPMAAVEL